jgi:hypothetical protein
MISYTGNIVVRIISKILISKVEAFIEEDRLDSEEVKEVEILLD